MALSHQCPPTPARTARRAVRSPVALVVGIGCTVAGMSAGLGWAGGLLLGATAWAVIGTARFVQLCGRDRGEQIDPFTLQDPWLSHVRTALTYRGKVRHLAGATRDGPLRERLAEMADRVDTAVDETWLVARRGYALSQARRAVTVGTLDREIDRIENELEERPGSEDLTAALEALSTQKTTAERLDGTIRTTDDRLRLMNARLGEIVSRSAELSAQAADAASLSGLSSDIASLVMDMEALRLALDDMDSDDMDSTGGPPPGPE